MRTLKFALLPLAAWAAFAATAVIDPNLYIGNVKYLASPDLKGRATGSRELEKAANFIAGKFREFLMGRDWTRPDFFDHVRVESE